MLVLRAEDVHMYKNSLQEPKFIVFINHLLDHGSHLVDLLLWVDFRRCATSVVREHLLMNYMAYLY